MHTEDNSYAQIVIPWSATSYDQLLQEFIDHPDADEIAVNNKGHWEHRYKRYLHGSDLQRIANIAKEDWWKKNFLDLYFKTYPNMLHERTKIGFTERDDVIVGYEMRFPFDNAHFFDWDEKPQGNGLIYALWEYVPLINSSDV